MQNLIISLDKIVQKVYYSVREVERMIVLKNVVLAYSKDYNALMNVNLTVAEGERVAIVGSEGAGKTALLRTIAGLEILKSGEVYIHDIPSKKVDFANDVNLGYVTEAPVFFERKTVFDNLAWVLKNRKVPKREWETQVRAVLDEFELSYLTDLKVCTLSKLERRQVQIARLALRPIDILLCDDIFADPDAEIVKQTKKCLKILIDKEPKNKTIVFSAENEQSVGDFVSKIYYLNGGCLEERKNGK